MTLKKKKESDTALPFLFPFLFYRFNVQQHYSSGQGGMEMVGLTVWGRGGEEKIFS